MSKSDPFNTVKTLGNHTDLHYYSLPALEESLGAKLTRLPICIRVILESLLRNCDGLRVQEDDIKTLAAWNAPKPQDAEVPFVVSRVVLQDFTGVPLLVDLAAMRDAVATLDRDAAVIEPEVPVDLIVDHSVQVDRARTPGAYEKNLELEFQRNRERYEFLKWGQGSFKTLKVVPSGVGICHQVNLEHLATVVHKNSDGEQTVLYPDTLVGTDSHTTMINGLGVVGWGVGGIEAEAAMLGQPVAIQMPEVIGLHMTGKLSEGITATDLTLRVTQLLRETNVVGKFVEFFGEGAAALSLADRATIGNMSPEYGATMGYFPVDERSLEYLALTGRDDDHIAMVKEYLEAQGMFGIPRAGEVDYTKVVELDLSTIKPCVSGPKRPQDRILVSDLKTKFQSLLTDSVADGGYALDPATLDKAVKVHSEGSFVLENDHETGGKRHLDHEPAEPEMNEAEMVTNRPITGATVNPGYSEGVHTDTVLRNGSVVIAAITSCTNTSNPDVMIGAGLVARNAVKKGLKVHPMVKSSLAPGSRVVTDYLEKTGLQEYLDALGFNLVAYGCTTCIGNSGPLDEAIEDAIKEHELITSSVLSGNRNFEARIHGNVKANFLMSPPLVVAYALAGTVDINLDTDPLGTDDEGNPVYLKDIWPSSDEIRKTVESAITPSMFKERYADVVKDSPPWQKIKASDSLLFPWDDDSTYIQKPPFFDGCGLEKPEIRNMEGMRPLALFGDSVTTDHISPAGRFSPQTPAGKYLIDLGVEEKDFNSYGSRRGNDRVMTRGTFANVRIRNELADGREGGYTKLLPEGELMSVFDACQQYKKQGTPLIVFAGKDYGMGSSRDWAAKGTSLLGVNAVVVSSYERIHRSNLIGMGVLPLEFKDGDSWQSLGIDGSETFTIEGVNADLKPKQEVNLVIDKGGEKRTVPVLVRLDTPIEVEYYLHGGILAYVLRDIVTART